jgi:glycosyltransferase involved in cell wall biosynthesis
MTTYNHEDYIVQSIEGVLSQKGDVLRELLILDDVSTDRTGEIADGYAARYPGLVRVIRPPVNLNSSAETRRAVEQATGEFAAFLDADDYWTDRDKLRKQVAFLDKHRDASMCFHDCSVIDETGKTLRETFRPRTKIPAIGHFRDIARLNYVASLSPLIRKEALTPMPEWADKFEWGDWALYLIAAEHGWIGYIPENMGTKRLHLQGSQTSMPMEKRFQTSLEFLREFALHSPPERAVDFDRGIAASCADLIANQLRTGNPAAIGRSVLALATMDRGMRRFTLAARAVRELFYRSWRALRTAGSRIDRT